MPPNLSRLEWFGVPGLLPLTGRRCSGEPLLPHSCTTVTFQWAPSGLLPGPLPWADERLSHLRHHLLQPWPFRQTNCTSSASQNSCYHTSSRSQHVVSNFQSSYQSSQTQIQLSMAGLDIGIPSFEIRFLDDIRTLAFLYGTLAAHACLPPRRRIRPPPLVKSDPSDVWTWGTLHRKLEPEQYTDSIPTLNLCST